MYTGSIPGFRRFPGEGKGYPLQYSGLENSMDCITHGDAKSWTWLSDFHSHIHIHVYEATWSFLGSSDGKESACTAGDLGSIPGSGRSPREGNEWQIHSSILAWRILWSEEPGTEESIGSQRAGHDWVTNTFKRKQERNLNQWHSETKWMQNSWSLIASCAFVQLRTDTTW